MGRLTEPDLARQAGTSVERVRRLAQLGVLWPQPDDRPFTLEDVSRVRLVEAIDKAGISLEDIGAAIEAGKLSFGWFQGLLPPPVPLSPRSLAEHAAELDVPLQVINRTYSAFGLADPREDARIREDDARELKDAAVVFNAMGRDEEVFLGAVRAVGQHLQQIAESQFAFFKADVVDRLFAEGLSAADVIRAADPVASQIVPLISPLLQWLHARHFETYFVQLFVQLVERAMEEAGFERPHPSDPPAVAFLDLSGFTRLTEEAGDETAVRLATRLVEFARSTAQTFGGRVVKHLGNGVMFHFPEPGKAVMCALALVEGAAANELPPARVGVHAGPMVYRDGDYFGRTVNTAARIVDYARPGEVLASEDVVSVWDDDGVRFQEVGPATLKGVGEPVALYAVREANRGPAQHRPTEA